MVYPNNDFRIINNIKIFFKDEENYEGKSNGYIRLFIQNYCMSYIFSIQYRNLSLIIFVGFLYLISNQSTLATIKSHGLFSTFIFPPILAQKSNDNVTTITNNVEKYPQKEHIITQASGHFANNQIKDGMVTWIQGGLWDLKIKSLPLNSSHYYIDNNSNKSNLTALFDASFTMIKPDGSLSHNHLINNFSSTNVIFGGNDIIITGIADIHSDIGIEYKQVPLTVHLMGKKVLGLMIDVNKTKGHFASPNEMYGTLISGIGLDNSNTNKTSNQDINIKIRPIH